MKYLTVLLGALAFLTCSCNNNNDEPPAKTVLPIRVYYQPMNTWMDESEIDRNEHLKELNHRIVVVNSAAELPDDGLGFSDAYVKADFQHYTMLIYYRIHRWEFEAYQYRYIFDNLERKYNWTIMLHVDSDENHYPGMRCISRFAIMVDKIPENAEVTAGLGFSDYNWNWSE